MVSTLHVLVPFTYETPVIKKLGLKHVFIHTDKGVPVVNVMR